MKWNVHFHPQKRYFHITKWLPYSLDDHRASLQEMFASAYWQPGMPVLSDITNLETAKPTAVPAEQVRELFGSFSDQFKNTKWAILCRTDLQYGLARQLQLLCESLDCPEMRVFRDEAEAMTWLSE
jgi:hypothetical protein